MGVLKGAVGCAVVALLAGHQLSSLDREHRAALWNAVRGAVDTRMPDPRPSGTAALPVPVPAAAGAVTTTPSFGEEWIAADAMGQFQITVEIDGRPLPALVDTGATFVSLSAEDADLIGVRPAPSDYRYTVNTANGIARVAKVQLASVRLGTIEVRNLTALVAGRGQLGRTLLGMSFLSRLSGVRIDRGRLILSR